MHGLSKQLFPVWLSLWEMFCVEVAGTICCRMASLRLSLRDSCAYSWKNLTKDSDNVVQGTNYIRIILMNTGHKKSILKQIELIFRKQWYFEVK